MAKARDEPAVESSAPVWPTPDEAADKPRDEPRYRPMHTDATGDLVELPSEATVLASELREVHYLPEGDFDQVRGEHARHALGCLRSMGSLAGAVDEEILRGRSSLVQLTASDAQRQACSW